MRRDSTFASRTARAPGAGSTDDSDRRGPGPGHASGSGPGSDKSAWYLPLTLTVDGLGAALPVHVLLDGVKGPAVCLTWLSVQTAHRRYGQRWLGETRGLLATFHDWLTLVGLLAVLRVLTGESSPPPVALLALAPAAVLTAACRALTHRHLTARRRQARAVCRALVVGEAGAVDRVVEQLAGRTDHPYVVVGAVPVGARAPRSGVPEAGTLDAAPPVPTAPTTSSASSSGDGDGTAVLAAALRHGAGTVLVVPGALLGGERVRRLSWSVQDAGLSLVVAPGLAEISPRRVRATTAAGLHLLHIDPPVRGGPQLAVKSALDRAGAALGLLVLTPLLLLLAAVVRLDSSGPALYRQTRIGRRGAPFTMWKFRSMAPEAERQRPLLSAANEADGPMFKVRADPRVTRVGRVLRRTSLDELPQLVNVLRGEMSLVGPRPPLPEEYAAYEGAELRRLHVKPGLTGPWQVSGRSDLSWDETLTLDLRYADNWSLTTDLDLLARTFRAVADGRGAY